MEIWRQIKWHASQKSDAMISLCYYYKINKYKEIMLRPFKIIVWISRILQHLLKSPKETYRLSTNSTNPIEDVIAGILAIVQGKNANISMCYFFRTATFCSYMKRALLSKCNMVEFTLWSNLLRPTTADHWNLQMKYEHLEYDLYRIMKNKKMLPIITEQKNKTG